jgi:hypothetical protein
MLKRPRLGMSEVTEKIRSRGYWEVAIRPLPLEAERVAYGDILAIIEAATVRMRGWPVPFIDRREAPIRAESWVGQDVDAELVGHHEAWRFFMSGQFNHLRAISADWRDDEKRFIPEGFDSVIQVWEVLFYLTEVFELASRLALGPAGEETMEIRVHLHNLENRGLIVGQNNRSEFFQPYRFQLNSIQREANLPREELVANAREHAVTMSREIFLRFGWEPSIEQLREHQQELTERG